MSSIPLRMCGKKQRTYRYACISISGSATMKLEEFSKKISKLKSWELLNWEYFQTWEQFQKQLRMFYNGGIWYIFYLVIFMSHLWYDSFDSINICFLFLPKYLILSSPLLLIMKPQKIDQLKWVCSKRLYFFQVGGHNNVGTQIPIVFQMSWLKKRNFSI